MSNLLQVLLASFAAPREKMRAGALGRRRHSSGGPTVRATVFKLLLAGFFLALAPQVAQAQSIPPTAPCVPGWNTTPAGWYIGQKTPDCSDINNFAGSGIPWDDGPIPVLPTGDDTFTDMIIAENFYGPGAHWIEEIGTTISGLVPGREYRIPFFVAPWAGREAARAYGPCEGLVATVGGQSQNFATPFTKQWAHKVLVFTASGTQETLTIKPQYTSGHCIANFALGVSPLDMIKTARLDGTSAGDTVTFTMTIENTGIETLTDVRISEDILERGDGTPLSLTTGPSFVSNSGSSPQGTLQPGEKATFTATYALTQADIEVGRLTNQAAGVGTSPTIGELSAYSSAGADAGEGPTEVTIPKTPAIRLDKSGTPVDTNGNGITDAGDHINYAFTVTNSGNVGLTDITVSDATPGVTVSGGPIPDLAPGEADSTTFSASYMLTQADLDTGRVQNTASVAGTSEDGATVEDEANVTVVLERVLRLLLEKGGEISDDNGNGALDAGETLTYTFAVTNTGNVALTDVTLDDPGVTVSGSPIASLAPGETDDTTYTATYVVTQADVDNGVYLNTATVSGNGPAGAGVIARDSATVPAEAAGKLRLEKNGDYVDANGNGIIDAGDRVDYTFVVTNAGNVTLSNVVVTDPDATVSGGPIASLAPGGSDGTTFTATLDLTQEHVDAGTIENTATATGLTPGGDTVTGEGSKSLVLAANERVALEKIAAHVDTNGNGIADVGDHIAYSFTVTNTGNVTLTGVSLDDPGVTVSGGPIATLRPGEADGGTFTASYPLTQADVDAGRVSNTATVTGTAPDGHSVDDTAQTVIFMEGRPGISLVKTGEYRDANGNGAIDAGDEIVYGFAVTNTGTVTLASVAPKDAGPLFDGKAGTGSLSGFDPASADLGPGASQTFAAAYRLSGEDISNAQMVENGIRNTATAEGMDPMGQPVESAEAWSVVDIFSEPDFEIGKTAAFVQVQRGQRVPYTIRVRMSGPLRSPVVNVIDEIPAGFAFVQGSATVDRTAVAPWVDGRRLTFENVRLEPEEEVEIGLSLTVPAAAEPGKYVNRTWLESLSGERLTPVATATVEVMVEPVFDCGDVIGKVFDDANRNGYQDDGERGLPGVRVATVSGLLITTDKHGRFHVACADLPDQRIGSTFLMKLDPRTLPTGYRMVSENPRTVRLTAGKASRLNFAAAIGRVVRLDLTAEAFEPGSTALRPEWEQGLGQLIALLSAEPSTLRLAYIDPGTDRRTAAKRTKAVRKLIQHRWKQTAPKYTLTIETRAQTANPDRTRSRRGRRRRCISEPNCLLPGRAGEKANVPHASAMESCQPAGWVARRRARRRQARIFGQAGRCAGLFFPAAAQYATGRAVLTLPPAARTPSRGNSRSPAQDNCPTGLTVSGVASNTRLV